MTTWLRLRSAPRRGGADPAVVGGDTSPFRLDELADDLTVLLHDDRPWAGVASSAPGTVGGGATGAVVVWGPDLLTVRVVPPRPVAGPWLRFELNGRPTTFHVHGPDGEVLDGALDQPGTQTRLRRVVGSWSRTALTVRVRVGGRTMFLSGQGVGGWRVRTADGRPVAEAAAGGLRVAREADPVERSAAVAVTQSVLRSSYLPLSTLWPTS
ncbi:hypothetical protein [Kineosporia sp. A_224]|uniref:hypothetical protein n=1 Tax=Kineosporia sp. A_224 TaxID=1962180 RepID=UPI000B4B6D73|nr:hypothetical protein [Kineosporia sp. A_224]